MRMLRRTGGAVAAAVVLAALPLAAAGAEDARTEAGALEVEVDRPLVMLTDEIEIEVDYELEQADEADEADEADGGADDTAGETDDAAGEPDDAAGTAGEADDSAGAADTADEAGSGFVAASEADGSASAAEPAAAAHVTFTVDLGDGSSPVTEVVPNESEDAGEVEAELELTHTYGAVGTYEIVVTATPDGGAATSVTTSVEVTEEPVAYPRPGDRACPEVAPEVVEPEVPAGEDQAAPEEVAAAGGAKGAPPALAKGFFTDVTEGSTHGHFISCLARAGLLAGVAPGQFAPGRSVSREQLATLLVRAIERSGVELPAGNDAFDDDEGSVHEGSIDALAAAGLLSGTADGSFRPEAPVTRAQMATFLTAVYERITEKRLVSAHDYFGDDDGSTHEGSINRAAAAGFAAGTQRGSFAPGREVSREQIATFLARMVDLVQEQAATTA